MRRFDEPIEVRQPLTAEAPEADRPDDAMQFLWRGRLWRVREVQSRWRETGAWWQHDLDLLEAVEGDLLAEQEVWRVLATSGEYGASGVYELARSDANGSWRLRSVAD